MAIDTHALAALDELRAGFTGQIIVPGDRGLRRGRTIFNAMIDRRPAVIAQCETASDVAAAIRFGREQRSRSRSAAAGTASPAWPSPTAASSSTCAG